jgi:superfamily II DNA or RNA helicase
MGPRDLELDDDFDSAGLDIHTFLRAAIGRAQRDPRSHAGHKTAPADWSSRLKRLSALRPPPVTSPWEGTADVDSELRYQLGVPPRPVVDGELTLRVVQRRRLAKGGWGEARAVDARRAEALDFVGAEDRRLLTLLSHGSGTVARPRFYRYSGPLGGSYELSDAFAVLVLPELAATGRLDHWSGNREPRTLAWDGGGVWRFCMRIDRTEHEVRLVGVLVRPRSPVALESGPLESVPLESVLQLVGRSIVETPRGLARLEAREGFEWLVELWVHGPLEVPETEEAALLALCEGLPPAVAPQRAAALSAPPSSGPASVGVPRPHLFVQPRRAGDDTTGERIECRISFDYGAAERIPPEHRERSLQRADGSVVLRDVALERARLAEYLRHGGRRTNHEVHNGSHGTLAVRRVPEVVRTLLTLGWSVTAEGKELRQATRSRVSVSSGLDWFEVEGGLVFGEQLVPFPTLLRAVRSGVKEVALGDGATGVLPEDWLAKWGLVELADGAFGDRLTFPKHQGWLLDALLAEREDVDTDEGFEQYRERLASFRKPRPTREPAGFQGELRPYQRDALGWFGFLRDMGFGGCLADDMGLGKTVQVLALLESRRELPRPGPSLVVAPRSLVFNWIDEARRFTPGLRVIEYTGADRDAKRRAAHEADLLVTTYGTLRLDAAELMDVRFDYLVLDEATAIKNDRSQAAKAARLLQADHRLALSGTPVENHIGELWSLFEFLNPGMLGRSSVFRELVGRGTSSETRRDLARALKPFFLRRTKSEVLTELPPKSEKVIYCELSAEERRRYVELRDHYRAELLGDDVGADDDGDTAHPGSHPLVLLEGLLRLRQAACHPGLLDPSRSGEDSAKLETLLPRIEELAREGHKVLVFSQFTSFLALVRARLEALGIRYVYLDGQTRDRKAPVERFQTDPTCPVFLISLKAGGHGLNLTASDYVFLLDPWWNPAVEAQAVDRAHRMGQTRPVMAYRLIAKDTVEERVLELQEQKRELAASLFGDGQGALKSLTREDLRKLLS